MPARRSGNDSWWRWGSSRRAPLRDLEHQILLDDGELLVAPTRTRRASGLTVRGYEMREELGRGAFGAVHRAYQPIVGREVAIKVIRPELADDPAFIRRFEAEAQLVAGLEHPHIVPLYDYWREPGAAYLVMRLVDAGSLADALRLGALPDGSRRDGVRSDLQRPAGGPPQRRDPPRHQAGEHPHRS